METAIAIYALHLGIDVKKEQDLMHIAEKALKDIPEGWELGFAEEGTEHEGIPYFYHVETAESSWSHPRHEFYLQLLRDERRKLKDKVKNSSSQSTKTMSDVIEIEEFNDDVQLVEPDDTRKKTRNVNADDEPGGTFRTKLDP